MPDLWRDQVLLVSSVIYEMIQLCFPVYSVWAIGIIVAWRRRRVQPRTSRIALLALGGFMLKFPLATLMAVFVVAADHFGWNRNSILNGAGFAEFVFEAGLWALVLVAIFGDRQPRACST